MTLNEIVTEYLTSHGYDGLYSPDGECACEIGDLWPCDCVNEECFAGHYVPCPGDGCEGVGHKHFHIGAKMSKHGDEMPVPRIPMGICPEGCVCIERERLAELEAKLEKYRDLQTKVDWYEQADYGDQPSASDLVRAIRASLDFDKAAEKK